MSADGIEVPYNRDLGRIETLLAGVRRPGDFFVQGGAEIPMPRVQVEGVGVLSFPVPAPQIRELIQQATRAPYGRGDETILDESVRKVWQIAAEQVSVGGKSWEESFGRMLATVTSGLGCGDVKVSAELYKLLVYDTGGFFKAHRDTEKVEGMFGTLVVVLPSAHGGGELVIRHAGREVVVDLSSTEVSEVRFAAFYADCEHEVRPVTEGNRVCLIYNLLQTSAGGTGRRLTAPLYDAEVGKAAELLREAFAGSDAPAKLVWLLQHQYSPAGLSFAGLKGEDAALAKVLRQAAEGAGCVEHLAIVHIEESGPAQPDYGSYRPRRWRRRYDDDEEDVSGSSYEVIEVSSAHRYISEWRDTEDRPVDFGQVPLEDGEVLPEGALDDEDPDSQRLTEATGNEGATFERSYRRAGLVLWPRDRFVDVLLQAGVGATLPYLGDRVAACASKGGTPAEQQAVSTVMRRVIESWATSRSYPSYPDLAKPADRAAMLRLLRQLGDPDLIEQFVAEVVTRQYDGSENEALAATVELLGPERVSRRLPELARRNMRWFHRACVELLGLSVRTLGKGRDAGWTEALAGFAAAMVEALPGLKTDAHLQSGEDWWRARQAKPVDARMVASLFKGLQALGQDTLRADAVTAISGSVTVFDPVTVVAPALAALHAAAPKAFTGDVELARLWRHAAAFLLARSEHPPAPPSDWRQEVTLSCKCAECRELESFTRDPAAQVHRFRVRQERRSHLEGQIAHHGLDMTSVTERAGSPQTLVCTKTRRRFQGQCEQHEADCAAMAMLLAALPGPSDQLATLAARMTAAGKRTAAKPAG